MAVGRESVMSAENKMRFICFSSGAQRRYRDDIIRAMAMPAGCELTFRYRLKYLAHAVQQHLQNDRITAGDQVLISYLDQSDPAQPVFFIPVRFASIIEAAVIGDFAVLRMRVEKLAYAPDLDVFNREVQTRSAEVPKWSSDAGSKHALGAYWIDVNDYPNSVIESAANADWQKTVGQLLARKDFAETGPFYRVVLLQEIGRKQSLEMNSGQFTLPPNTEYELVMDHFLTRESPGTFQLEVVFTGGTLAFITGSKVQIDSPYNRHWFRFKSAEPLVDQRAVITITKKMSGEDPLVQFDLPVLVTGRRRKAVMLGFGAGFLLAVPQITTAWMNPAFAPRGLTWLVALSGFIAAFNIAVGIAAALNFRKPIG